MITKNTGAFNLNYVTQSLKDILAEKDEKKGKCRKKWEGSKSKSKLKARLSRLVKNQKATWAVKSTRKAVRKVKK